MLRHFPLIPMLKHMFHTPTIFELIVWHSKNKNTNGLVRHPCDSKAQKHIHNSVDFSFGHDECNMHLGLATNTFKLQRSTWSTWPECC